MRQCQCGSTDFTGVEYDGMHPEHYDGVSEWACNVCGTRYGRWTGKILSEHEFEKRSERFGQPRSRHAGAIMIWNIMLMDEHGCGNID